MGHRMLILGAGRIGTCIARALAGSGRYEVTLADKHPAALKGCKGRHGLPGLKTQVLDVEDRSALRQAMKSHQAVLSACSFHQNRLIAECALKAGLSYFDLTEDVATTRHIRDLAQKARQGQIFMPQCGLAPGFISILGNEVAQRFDELHTLRLRVGALPEFPSNQLMYNLTWSTEGLINEYCNPCEAIRDGRPLEVLALEGLETFSLDGLEYEAFNTSGGLGTLCERWQGRVRELNYKTIRYPGHCRLMHFLINDLRLGEPGGRRDMLKQIFESSLAGTHQDLVLILVAGSGLIDGKLMNETEVRKVYHGPVGGEEWSAIQQTTALSAAVVVDLHFTDMLSKQGFVRQEEVSLARFMNSEFAWVYQPRQPGAVATGRAGS
jgi:saccharopine dehydrogenase-like NADP-dependent oxidoreductase